MGVINLHLMYVDFIRKRASITRQADIRTMLAQAAAKAHPTLTPSPSKPPTPATPATPDEVPGVQRILSFSSVSSDQ